jgi:formylglycine-generating enzyme required for sulfatase activity
MGCSAGDYECSEPEKPPHEVTITRGFWMGQTPVTVGAYKRYAGSIGRRIPPAPNFNSGWMNENMPIVNVTWEEAQAYCGWIGTRLPTEAEWEYAARGGSTEARYGSLDDIAWYSNNSDGQTHDVAQKRANGFGLYDALGNVSEWVNDWYDENYYQGSPAQDPEGPGYGQYRVLRGGAYYLATKFVRLSYRFRVYPDVRITYIGFRCGGNAEQALPLAPVEMARRPVSAPRTGQVRDNPKDGLKYVWIAPGTFTMGCSAGDYQCLAPEKPPHQVTITKGFWMGQTPVTVGAFKRFAESTGHRIPPAPNFNSGWMNENMPIVDVRWDEAQAYCGWIGGRLPTEAEWEYAARGGSTEARYGSIDDIAWNNNNSGRQTHDVAQKRANGFGLYDMLGNVNEWVNDWYDENYYQSSPAQDPQGPGYGQFRVRRGAGYAGGSMTLRFSSRFRLNPNFRVTDLGFRCGGDVFGP